MASLISPPASFAAPLTNSADSSCLYGNFCFKSSFLKKPLSLSSSHSHLSFSCSPSYSLSRPPESNSAICCCRSNSSDAPSRASDSDQSPWFRQFFISVAQKLEDFLSRFRKDFEIIESMWEDKEVDDWDWNRWQRYFDEVDDQERMISILKAQLTHAVEKEDYEDAARLKIAVAAAATKDTVGAVMSTLKKAIEEERYKDAIFMRDNAGAGLVGWWAGVSDDGNDPYGCIIHISAEHGRYVARSYSPRELAISTNGVPLFEIFLTLNEKGEYRHKAVYLKWKVVPEVGPSIFPKSSTGSGSMNKMNPAAGKTDIFAPAVEDALDSEDEDDPELADGLSGLHNLLHDMIPGVIVEVLKETGPGKLDRDLISKVGEQIIEEEEEEDENDDDEEEDEDEKGVEAELDGIDTEDGISSESEEEKDDGSGDTDGKERRELFVKFVVNGPFAQKLAGLASPRYAVRVPAKLEPKGRKSFTFCVQDDEDLKDSVSKEIPKRKAKSQGHRSIEHVMADLAKFISRGEKIPVKLIKDIDDIFNIALNQAQTRQPLSGCTSFSRIDLPVYPDPLNGLYIGSHGPYTSEVIQLKCKFGQWQEDGGTEGPSDLHFYEYVEAVKLTGDPYVPAGKVAFRAKIGKRYQLPPHKGVIPEEIGVVARYKGQGRLADPGFQNPRWVDGELIILDGKFIKGGPVVGFVYWAPEYQFLVVFNRLRIQD